MIKQLILTTLLFASVGNCMSAQAQLPGSFSTDRLQLAQGRERFEDFLDQFKTKVDRLQNSIDRDLDRSKLDNTDREDRINERVKDFRKEVDSLRDRYKDREPIRQNIDAVLRYRSMLDSMMQRSRFVSETSRRNWADLRPDLDRLQRISQGSNRRPGSDRRF